VAFFSISIKYNGVIGGDGWYVFDSSVMTGLVNTAHAHGVKVVVSLTGPASADLCNALYNSLTTTQQIVAQVVAKNLDGVNIDIEGQLAMCNPTNPGFVPQTNQALLTRFAQQLRTALDSIRPGYYLSIDTYSGSAGGTDGFFNIPDLNQYVDSFFVMAYDMDYANLPYAPLNCSSFCMNPVSPLTTYNYNDTISMSQYSAVVGAGKTILGQPYYGRVACVSSPVAHAPARSYLTAATYLQAAAAASDPDVKPGTYTTHRDANDPTGLDRWDTWYDNTHRCWREMYWSDVTQLGARYDFVNQTGLRGVGFWTLNYGGAAPELWAALEGHFVRCANAQVNANLSSPQLMGAVVQIVASSSNCPIPLYQFWVFPPHSRTWQLAQAYSSDATYNWDSASHPPGTYEFAVWARDIASAGSAGGGLGRWDALTTLTYTLNSATFAPCTGVTAAVAPTPPILAGTQVTVTATPTGCPNPRYEFWMENAGSSVWRDVQPYSTSASFIWNTLGEAAGTYRFSVWARDSSSFGTKFVSLGTWDAFSSPAISVFTKPCTGVTASSAPPSPQLAATAITVIAAASAACPGPNYQFWLLAPGATSWKVAQAYSPSAAFNWDQSAVPAGVYGVAVWVRDNSSNGTSTSSLGHWDALTGFTYTLTSRPCIGMSATLTPAGSASTGTTVSIAATAAGCSSPQFQFWMLAPGSNTWQIVQPYSSTATFSWATTGKAPGVYQLAIWARDKSSIGTSGDAVGTWDAYSMTSYTLT
jgi:spore germination protein YaaH